MYILSPPPPLPLTLNAPSSSSMSVIGLAIDANTGASVSPHGLLLRLSVCMVRHLRRKFPRAMGVSSSVQL